MKFFLSAVLMAFSFLNASDTAFTLEDIDNRFMELGFRAFTTVDTDSEKLDSLHQEASELLRNKFSLVKFPSSLNRAGDVATLDDPVFDENQDWPEMGENWDDYWAAKPVRVYLLKKYDPSKIPLVLVHGFWSNPRYLRSTVEKIKTDRYQIMVLHYPSSAPVKEVSIRFRQSLLKLKKRYGFDKAALVGHSMGGVVIRAMLVQSMEDNTDMSFVKTVVTLATPHKGIFTQYPDTYEKLCLWIFDGHYKTAAESYAGSTLFKWLNSQKLSNIRCFAFAGDRPKGYQYQQLAKIITGISDGLVSKKSAIWDEAENFTVHEDHSTITENPEVLWFLNNKLFQ